MKTYKSAILLGLALLLVFSTFAAAQDSSADLYKAKCAMCHGADGKASTGMGKTMGLKPLSDPEVQAMSDADLAALITNGKGKMPAMKGKLTDDQIKGLVKYVKSMK